MSDDPRPQPPSGLATRRRRPDERQSPRDVGEEPDPRFTLANERTFLAWNRTALGLIAAGAAAAAFLGSDLGGAGLLVAVPLILLGALLAVSSYRHWERNERAMRMGDPLPHSGLPRVLALSIGVLAAIAAVLTVIDIAVS